MLNQIKILLPLNRQEALDHINPSPELSFLMAFIIHMPKQDGCELRKQNLERLLMYI